MAGGWRTLLRGCLEHSGDSAALSVRVCGGWKDARSRGVCKAMCAIEDVGQQGRGLRGLAAQSLCTCSQALLRDSSVSDVKGFYLKSE